MAHPTLTGSGAGAWFVRLGHLEGWWLDITSLQGNTATTNVLVGAQTPTRLAQVQADYAAGTADYIDVATIEAAGLAMQANAVSALGPAFQGAIQNTLISMCNNDTSQSALTVAQAVTFLIWAMKADAATINQGTLPAAGAQTNGIAAAPVGNPTFIMSVVDAAGRGLQYIYPETVTFAITQDSQTAGGATAGQEPYSVIGQNANPNGFLAFDWLLAKYGSGASGTGNLADPMTNNAGTAATTGNVLVNGAFLVATTANVADNWTIATGTAGTNILVTAASGGYITGSGILTMVSDGATLLSITQSFNTPVSTGVGTGGTPFVLLASAVNNAQYAVYVPYKLSVASPAAGVMEVALVDSTGAIINDDAGTANSFTVALTGVADTNFHIASGIFRMPQALSTNTPFKLRIRQSTAVTTGKNLILSCAAMAPMTQLYAGGPYFVGFRGSTNPNASGTYPDTWTIAITYTPGKEQRAMWRWFNPPALTAPGTPGPVNPGLIVPAVASGSATISDALVV